VKTIQRYIERNAPLSLRKGSRRRHAEGHNILFSSGWHFQNTILKLFAQGHTVPVVFGLCFLIDFVLNIVANVWEWTYVKAQTTLFPQSILHASCLISKAIDINWSILNLHKLYYTKKKKKLLISLSLLADCSNQNGFEKQTVKIRIKKISPGVYQHSWEWDSIFFYSVIFFRFVLYSVLYMALQMQIDSERVMYRWIQRKL
jgi:hypothetical protein